MLKLALQAGKNRQSPRTGFVHDGEVIPIYENYCFALALFRHKTMESVKEGKELIERLLALGCFPAFFHDFPRCYDFQMPLKVAPILIYLLRDFSPVLGELKGKIEEALKKIARPEKSSWENRYRACVGEPLLPHEPSSPTEWREWIITAQLAGINHFSIPYDADLQMFVGNEVQEKGEPRPNPIEWLLADGKFSPRLLRDHPHQLLCAPLYPVVNTPPITNDSRFWKGATIHSLVERIEMNRQDLFEAAYFTDISPETEIFVNQKKATSFKLGDVVTIQTPALSIDLCFELIEGSGDFFGHIFRANRPTQIEKEVYDWQIGLRTLRRSGSAQLRVAMKRRTVDGEAHRMHSIVYV